MRDTQPEDPRPGDPRPGETNGIPADVAALRDHFGRAEVVEAMEAGLRSFVEIESGTLDGAGLERMADSFRVALSRSGFTVEEAPGGVIAGRREGETASGGPRVLIVGHVDTVYPPGESFRGLIEREVGGVRHLVGPGAVDMKGGLVVALSAVDAVVRLAAQDGAPLGPITFAVNRDEEQGSPASRETLFRLAAEHDIAVVVEPGFDTPGGGSTIVDARAGLARVRCRVIGVESHAGNQRGAGLSAVATAARLVRPIDALTNETEDLLVTVCTFDGGNSINQVPGHASLGIDVRFRDDVQWRYVQSALATLAEETVDENETTGDRTRIEIEILTQKDPMPRLHTVTPHLEAIVQAGRDLGQALHPGRRNGTSDGNHTAAAGTPTLDGIGVVGFGMHVAGVEAVRASSLPERAALLALWLRRLWAAG